MSRLGRFELLRKIGSGGMGAVWKAAVHGPAGFQKIVAVKQIRTDREELVDELVGGLIQEAKLVAKLQHPNIVQVFDFGAVDDEAQRTHDYFIAMEYVAGQNLAQVVSRLTEKGGSLAHDIAIWIGCEVARALSHAHGTGGEGSIVHRDLSPHNILISYDGVVKITDFGVAKLMSSTGDTGTDEVRGKLRYMSPEQIRGLPMDHRTDIFALGCVLYELVTGEQLFQGNEGEVVYKVTTYDPNEDERILALGDPLTRILRRALAYEPENRYADAYELEADLTEALDTKRHVMARRSLTALMRLVFKDEIAVEDDDEEALETGRSQDETVVAAKTVVGVPPSQTSLRSRSLLEGTPLPRGGEPETVVGWNIPTDELPAASGVQCKACGNIVENFLGGGDLCFSCLDSSEQQRAGNETTYVRVNSGAVVLGSTDGGPQVVAEAKDDEVELPSYDPDAKVGWFTVTSDSPVDIWVDGVRLRTPVERYVVQPGQHQVVAVAGAADLRLEETVVIQRGATVHLFVDIKNRTTRRW